MLRQEDRQLSTSPELALFLKRFTCIRPTVVCCTVLQVIVGYNVCRTSETAMLSVIGYVYVYDTSAPTFKLNVQKYFRQ